MKILRAVVKEKRSEWSCRDIEKVFVDKGKLISSLGKVKSSKESERRISGEIKRNPLER